MVYILDCIRSGQYPTSGVGPGMPPGMPAMTPAAAPSGSSSATVPLGPFGSKGPHAQEPS
eukprot:12930980-Prorocentrum_lima.AAC.1